MVIGATSNSSARAFSEGKRSPATSIRAPISSLSLRAMASAAPAARTGRMCSRQPLSSTNYNL